MSGHTGSPRGGLHLGLLVVVAALCAVAGLGTAPAAGATVTQQGTAGHPFSFERLPDSLQADKAADGSQELRLRFGLLGRIDATSPVYAPRAEQGGLPDPRSVQVLPDGHLLIADRAAATVTEVTPDGTPVWAYTTADDPQLERPFSAERITVDGEELTLIADRWAARVFAVNEAKEVVWQYGVARQYGLGVDRLQDPFCATYSSAAGTVLIADNNGASRVLEVRWADFRADAVDKGFTAASVVWQYGTPGVAGSGPGQLRKPRSPQRLPNGDVFMGDADGHRFFVVDRRSKAIVWQYGHTDEPGDGLDSLRDPTYGRRLADGRTLIADTGNHRVLLVPAAPGDPVIHDMDVLGRPGSATQSDTAEPRGAAFDADGALWVADSAFAQLTRLGYPSSGQVESAVLDCGAAGARKAFVRLSWQGDVSVPGTSVAVDYRIDGGAWRACAGLQARGSYDFPAGTVGKTLAYRVRLGTTEFGATPRLDALTIATEAPTAGADGGGGGGVAEKGDNSAGSGVFAYPAPGLAPAGGSGSYGAGTGSGSAGSGGGSGSGAGPVTGAGASTAVPAAPAVSAAAAPVPPVPSSGGGTAQQVSGVAVGGPEGVTGIPLTAVSGGHEPAPEPAGPGVPAAFYAAAALVVLLLVVPSLQLAARLRRLSGFDHVRLRRYPPFRLLDRAARPGERIPV